MDDDACDSKYGALSVQLDVHLDRQPVTGRLRTRHGANERFVGWLGFVEALKRAKQASTEHRPVRTQGATVTDNTKDTKPILVVGGTGKTGRRVVERLRAGGLPVRVGSRSGQPPFDWEDPSTWAPVLQGARAAYIPYPDLVLPGAATKATRAFAELAIEHGVTRLVMLTGRGEDEAQRGERELQATGADVTIVRCAWFMQIFSEDFLLDSIRAGEVLLPATDDQLDPFVDADDIADVAVAALTEPGHAGQVYELTSPRLLSLPEAIAEIAKASSREITYVPVSVEEFAAGVAEYGVPAELVDFLTYLFSDVLGKLAYVTNTVERVLGRPPRDFTDFATRTAATGIWTPTADR